eukprot:6001701-Alexandrium_andersonii.AAC.1
MDHFDTDSVAEDTDFHEEADQVRKRCRGINSSLGPSDASASDFEAGVGSPTWAGLRGPLQG